ncbi:MAG: hypothetical protein PHH08_03930 [Candidatus ainarchaeum sp.]|nr:hypothetical protein [Candidatus ainarchaeum sp.]
MNSFECEICNERHGSKKDAEACCSREKIAALCNVCGKTNPGKKAAINCCGAVKKNFSKTGLSKT